MLNNIPLTYEARRKKLEEGYLQQIENLDKYEEYIQAFLGNKLCKSSVTNAYFFHSTNGLSLTIYDVDLPTVIDHICGPIHRKYNVDWKLHIPYDGRIELTAMIPKPGRKSPPRYSWDALVCFTINLNEQSMKSCEIVRVKKREKTAEEITRSVQSAADPFEYEYRIDCGGE